MPRIVRFYVKHCLIGFGVAAAFIGGMLYFDVAGLWHLISGSDIGVMALIVFWVLNGIVFAGVQTAVAVMMLAEDDRGDTGPQGGKRALIPVPQTVPVTRPTPSN